jgi:ribosomal protein S18 acetylase RimI-like enzyme
MINFTITQLSAHDWNIYKSIRLRSLQEECCAFFSSYEEEVVYPDAYWIDTLQHHYFVQSGADVVGMAGILYSTKKKTNHTVSIVNVYVDHEFRRIGIGRQLMQHVLKIINQNPVITMVFLETISCQKYAIQLYESLGFVRAGVKHSALSVNNTVFDQILFELPIRKIRE